MITKRKVVLEVTQKAFFERFEAIEEVERLSQIQEVWERNKTPMISKENMTTSIVDYDIIKVQEDLIGDKDAFIDFCHSHEFECGEYRTGEFMTQERNRVFFVKWQGTKVLAT